jgi:hypothetical protein
VEITTYNTFTNIGSNLTPFGNISKSGDGGHSGDILHTLATFTEAQAKDYNVNDI